MYVKAVFGFSGSTAKDTQVALEPSCSDPIYITLTVRPIIKSVHKITNEKDDILNTTYDDTNED